MSPSRTTKAEVVFVEAPLNCATIGLVSSLEDQRAPADLGKNERHRVRALPASPAIDERFEVGRLFGKRRIQVVSDIAGNKRSADTARQEARLLNVSCTNDRSLGIVEHGKINSAWDVILGKLVGTADVYNHVELSERFQIDRLGDSRI